MLMHAAVFYEDSRLPNGTRRVLALSVLRSRHGALGIQSTAFPLFATLCNWVAVDEVLTYSSLVCVTRPHMHVPVDFSAIFLPLAAIISLAPNTSPTLPAAWQDCDFVGHPPTLLNDTYCDADLNNGDCGYDGGASGFCYDLLCFCDSPRDGVDLTAEGSTWAR